MKITAVKPQVKRADRFSVFVDGAYAFSLGEAALLESGLASGQEISAGELKKLQKLSGDDKIYNQALRYAALRPCSRWEVAFYLEKKKKASPALTESILNKLSNMALIDDEKFARAFVNDRRLLRPTSSRRLTAELRRKHIADDVIEGAVGVSAADEQAALQAVIERKRRQTAYQDDRKLMQYLARQGFGYDDIKAALQRAGDR